MRLGIDAARQTFSPSKSSIVGAISTTGGRIRKVCVGLESVGDDVSNQLFPSFVFDDKLVAVESMC